MFLIRRSNVEDVPTLLKLAKMVHFINLPADRDIIAEKVMWSRECFVRALAEPTAAPDAGGGRDRSDLFMFTLEDTESGSVLGTSQLIARIGGPGQPNVCFQLSPREMFSKTLQVGATHVVAKLVLDETGPTEIGGLILQPSFRSHKMKLGRLLSFVRFHFIALHRRRFADRVLAEMMGAITPDGRNTLWEYLGRRFINLTYTEADRFCQYSKEFITSLLPREEIYLTLLPPEARSVIAQVGPETIPARRMLERLGFRYNDRIDPFDGGPNLEADTDSLWVVQRTRRSTLGSAAAPGAMTMHGIVSVLDGDGEFRGTDAAYMEDRAGRVRLTKATLTLLRAEPGMAVGVTPFESLRPTAARAGNNGSARRAKPAKGGGAAKRRAAR